MARSTLSFTGCSIQSQKEFGPNNDYCYGGFDFTLFFEEVFLTIVPFFVVFPFLFIRFYRLCRAPVVVDGVGWHHAKQIMYVLYASVQLLSLGAIVMPTTIKTEATVIAVVVSVLATLFLSVVSSLEHHRNPRPSSPVSTYLLISLIFDVARVRTLHVTESGEEMRNFAGVGAVIKLLSVLLELKEKRAWLCDPKMFPAPESTANFFNRLTFFWVNPMLLKGYRHPIQEQDLPEVQDQIIGDKHLLSFAERWEQHPFQDKPNELFKLVFKHHWRSFASAIIPRICYSGFNFSQSFLLQRTLKYLTTDNYANRPSIGHGLIAAYVFVYCGFGITNAYHQHRNYRSISKLRGSLIGVIYKKTLGMSASALAESEAVTLMNADVERITVGLRQCQELWAGLYEIGFAVFLLHKQISWAALTPLGVIFICTGAAIGVSPKLAASQKTWLDKIQARVDATASMLGSMKAVKMTGLTPDLGQKVHDLRESEINTARTFRGMLVKITTFSFASTSISPVVALGTYSLMAKYQGYPMLTLERSLTTLVLMQLLLEPVGFFINALSGLINTMSCMERIRKYLNTELRNDPSHYNSRVSLKSRYRTQSRSSSRPVFSKVSLDVTTKNKSSYPQNPFRSSSDKFASFNDYDYDAATLASLTDSRSCIVAEDASCGWDRAKVPVLSDLNFRIKEGSLTMIVGPVSSGKSTLLKALLGETPLATGISRSFSTEIAYCAQTAWLINDTLRQNIINGSEFDPEWYAAVIQACDLDIDIGNMANGDGTVVGSKGLGLSGGQQQRVALARAVYFRKPVVMIDDVFCGLDASTENRVFEGVLGENGLLRGTDTTILFVTNAVHRLPQADHVISLGTEGTITEQGTYEDLCHQDGYVGHLALGGGERNTPPSNERKAAQGFKQSLIDSNTDEKIEEEKTAGDITVYKYYIQTFGWIRWSLFCIFCAMYAFGTAFPNVWVKWWATYNQDHPAEDIPYYLGMYGFFAILGLSSLVLACWTLIMTMTPRAGRKLHERMLQTVLNAPMSFFATTDTGITTNRFSQDLELIDMELPVALIRTSMMFFVLIAQLLVILTSAKYVGIAMPAIALIIYFLQVYYLRTSRRLRILDIETKAYLGTQFLEMLNGLITVRAFQWEYHNLSRFVNQLKKAQRPFYLMYCIQRWLNMILDLIVGGMAILLVTVAIKTKKTVDPGMTGLALTNLVGFSQMLKQLITNWTLLETSMGALSRIRSFTTSIESENLPGESNCAPEYWPKLGGIEFRNVVASYSPGKKPTLNDISFAIPPGTKLALVGRSGSGKSSLISVLLRLIDLQAGSITIDGLDIATLPRQLVRSRLIALPQDPYVLSATVRENVDPLCTVPDDEIITALRKVHLDHLLDDEDKGLDVQLTTEMLSHGQCQLLCLARAMIRRSSILILDEATASVDVHTDALVQNIIRTEFMHHTIIAAAHRLDTIIDFDAVLVLDAGRILETDSPANLLARDSNFRELYQIQKGESTEWHDETLEQVHDAGDRISEFDVEDEYMRDESRYF